MDRRIIRTRELIIDSFCALLTEKPISKISVTELCQRAGINRNTFYSHYESLYVILKELESSILSQLSDALMNAPTSEEAITLTCRLMKENQTICQTLLSPNAESDFASRFLTLSYARNSQILQKKNNPLSPSYQKMLSSYLIEGSAAVIRLWSQNGMQEDAADVAAFIMELCYHGSTVVSVHPAKKAWMA